MRRHRQGLWKQYALSEARTAALHHIESSNIESEMKHIAFLDDVLLAFKAQAPGIA